MVSLALFSMVGMMGLAVDLGYSYFVQKGAQAAADTAALAAADEAVIRLGVTNDVSGFNCGSAGTGATQVECTETAGSTVLKPCATIMSGDTTSNLNNGCQYAMQNFKGLGPTPIVNMQSGDVTDTNAPPGVNRISYWVRVRVIQTVPQLFSFLAGNQKGTVAANATAAIAGSISPGSFFGMNHAGDCWNLPGGGSTNCGVDLDAESTGQGKTACPGSGGGYGQVCAPAGVILASTCNSSSAGGSTCSSTAGGQFAGNATTGNGVETSSLVVMGASAATGGATPGTWLNASGATVSPTYSTSPLTFVDPTSPHPQPPLQTTNLIPACGLQNINGTTTLAGTAGPYQYYSYSLVSGQRIPDGNQITISGTATFTNTSSAATCPGILSTTGTVNQSGTFNTFIFYGGLAVNGTMNLTAGQYVLAGTNLIASQNVLDMNGVIQPAPGDNSATNTGTMFIFTDGSYPGLGGPASQGNTGSGQITAIGSNWNQMPALYQGSLGFKNPTVTMNGLIDGSVGGSALPSPMSIYDGIAWWQDRRNSMVEYNQCVTASIGCPEPTLAPNCGNCTADNGTVIGCADQTADGCTASQTTGEIVTDNHVTATSPGVVYNPGTGSINITGVYYQPRGAWIQIVHGTGFGTGDLQIITGSAQLLTGDDRVLLIGPTNPLITYKASLVQ